MLTNSVHPLGNMKTNFKFEVNWGSDSKDIAFTNHITMLYLQMLKCYAGSKLGELCLGYRLDEITIHAPVGKMICVYKYEHIIILT